MLRRTLRCVALAALTLGVVGAGAPVASAHVTTDHDAVSIDTDAKPANDTFGDAPDLGSMRGARLAQPIVGIASTASGKGYWLVARDGGIFSFGDAAFFGSTGAMRLNQPIVGMARTPSGNGYWFVASDGGVFSYGDAVFHGSTGAIRLNQPIVGMASTPSGNGYWLVARDGGIFAFGDATFFGSTGAIQLNQPIVGMAATTSGSGYWLVANDGGIFTFGDAAFRGSAAGRLGPVVGIAPAGDGEGYWVSAANGAVGTFGAAASFGAGATSAPVVGIAPTPSGKGYLLAASDGGVLSKAGPPAADPSSFAFLRTSRSGGPVRYDPCTPVHYVINPAGSPAGAVDEVQQAFGRLGSATGISFVYDGATSETHVAFGQRKTYQPDRYGPGWAPILISWTTAAAEPLLNGNVLGYGGSSSVWSGNADEAYVTGEVVFDTVQEGLRGGFGPGLTRGNLELHEIGHVVGLDHVQDPGQVMHPSIGAGTPDGYAAGDLNGLSQLGRDSGCLTVASPSPSLA